VSAAARPAGWPAGAVSARRGRAVIADLILESMPVGAVGLIGLTVAGAMGLLCRTFGDRAAWLQMIG